MNVKCPNCLKIFQPNIKDEKFIKESIAKKQELCMIECTKCYQDVPIAPNNLLSIQGTDDNKEIIQCPICKGGIVSYIDDVDEQFWGCGECGNVWFSNPCVLKN